MLQEPLRVDAEDRVLPAFQRYHESQGFTRLRHKVRWDGNGPVDVPFEEGWGDL